MNKNPFVKYRWKCYFKDLWSCTGISWIKFHPYFTNCCHVGLLVWVITKCGGEIKISTRWCSWIKKVLGSPKLFQFTEKWDMNVRTKLQGSSSSLCWNVGFTLNQICQHGGRRRNVRALHHLGTVDVRAKCGANMSYTLRSVTRRENFALLYKKNRRSSKSLAFILWGSWKSGQKFMAWAKVAD